MPSHSTGRENPVAAVAVAASAPPAERVPPRPADETEVERTTARNAPPVEMSAC